VASCKPAAYCEEPRALEFRIMDTLPAGQEQQAALAAEVAAEIAAQAGFSAEQLQVYSIGLASLLGGRTARRRRLLGVRRLLGATAHLENTDFFYLKLNLLPPYADLISRNLITPVTSRIAPSLPSPPSRRATHPCQPLSLRCPGHGKQRLDAAH
jgi:hypothetical protein